ncbi:MAG: hypothetical protein WCV67_02910 [Victivallaceae bacterium]|jgi:hypothetical protein
MTDGARLVLKQTILHLQHTKSLTASDSCEALQKLGIEKNGRHNGKTRKTIPPMPADDNSTARCPLSS